MLEKLNINPKRIKAADCVVRAIAYATDQIWEAVYDRLYELGRKMKRMPSEKQVYEKYLQELNWCKNKQPRRFDNTKYTVDEFCDEFPKARYIVSVANHLTVVEDRYIVDTWNCGRKSVCNYWEKV